jgi:hypothetical protein
LPADRNHTTEDQIRKRIDEIKFERDKLQDIFNQRFLDYVALSKPQPLTIEQTQAVLLDDEALITVVEEVISQKRRLSFVFDRALTSLPPQVLITSDPGDQDLVHDGRHTR